jgi:ABC-2 type transport system permease protein
VIPRLYASGAGAVVLRDWLLFKSYPMRFLSHVLAIFFSVALFYYVSRLISVEQFGSPDRYFAFVVVGLATLEVLTATLSVTPGTLRGELVAGTFERMAASALGPVAGIAAMMVFPTLLATAGATLTLAFGGIVFGMPLNWPTALLAIPTAMLGALAFFPFALLLSGAVLVVKQAGTGAAFIVSALSIAGGAMFPTTLLPSWLHWIADVQPLTPALDLLRWELTGSSLQDPGVESVIRLILFTAILIPLGLLTLRAAVRFCRKRGTLMEY